MRLQDAAANLTISSPLEAHKARAIIHSIVSVDVGFDNPLFAALEVDYSESDQDPSGEAYHATEKVRTQLHSSLLLKKLTMHHVPSYSRTMSWTWA